MNANESVWIKINRTRCKPLIIGNVYRPPNQPVDNFLDNLNKSLSRIDSNCDGKIQIFRLNEKLQGITGVLDLKQVITEPTRVTEHSESLIDLVFTNTHHKVTETGVFDLGLSDHSLVYCVLKSGRPRVAPKTIEYRSYKNYNKQSFIKDLENVPWHVVFNNTEKVDYCVNTWNKME